MKSKYARHSTIPKAQVRQIVRLFSLDLTALQLAALSSIHRNTVSRCLPAFRGRTARSCGAESPVRRRECAEARGGLSAETVSRAEYGSRFSHRQEDISPLMLRLLRTDPLS